MGPRFCKGGRGWHYDYDNLHGAAYLYNDDPNSPYASWFISYENALSLQDKLDDVRNSGLARVIIWEVSQDTEHHRMIHQMAQALL